MMWAIGGSLLLHGGVLAWMQPVATDIKPNPPAVLEVRLIKELPSSNPTAVAPSRPVPAPSVHSVSAKKHEAHQLEASQGLPVVPVYSSVPQDVAVQSLPPVTQKTVESVTIASAVPNPVPPTLIPPDVRAAYLSNPRPPYPLSARRKRLEGRVLLRAEILPDGTCSQLSLEQGSGHDILDQAAMQAVKAWRFVPARRGDEAVRAWVDIPVSFRLDGHAD